MSCSFSANALLMYHVGEYVRSRDQTGATYPLTSPRCRAARCSLQLRLPMAFHNEFAVRSRSWQTAPRRNIAPDRQRPLRHWLWSIGAGRVALFGNDSTVLTALHREEIDAKRRLLRPSSARYGLRSNCTIADLPTSHTERLLGRHVHEPAHHGGVLCGDVHAAGMSGSTLPGVMVQQELRVYELHELVMRLSSSRTSSESFGSALPAYDRLLRAGATPKQSL